MRFRFDVDFWNQFTEDVPVTTAAGSYRGHKKNKPNLFRFGFDQRHISFEVVNVSTGDVVATFGATSISESNSSFHLNDTVPIPNTLKTNAQVKIRLKADNISSVLTDLQAAVINIYYLSGPSTQGKRNSTLEHVGTQVSAFILEQNYPNPFNATTKIGYSLPNDIHVYLKIYNVLGQEVISLVDEVQSAGYKTVNVDAGTMPSGIYFYRLQAGNRAEVKKMLLTK